MESFTPDALIEIWAARCCGSELDETPRWLLASLRSGGVGADETAAAIMHYVESVDSFRRARPALVWAHILGRHPSEYRPNSPGETHRAALIRMGWGEFLSAQPVRLCQSVLDQFTSDLLSHLDRKPFFPPNPLLDEPDAQTVAAQVNAEVEISLSRARTLAVAARERRTASK